MTKVIATRTLPNGYIRRRRVDAAGVRHWTIEVPETVWNGINKQGRDNDRAAAFARVVNRAALELRALQHLQDGWKAIASAHDLGVPLRTVQRWRRQASNKEKRK